MEIKKNKFVYKVAFPDVPFNAKSISICTLIFHFIYGLLIEWPIKIFRGSIIFIGVAIVGVLVYGISFLFAKHPGASSDPCFEHYKKWPKIGKYRILPIWILVIAMAIHFHEPFVQLIVLLWNGTILLGMKGIDGFSLAWLWPLLLFVPVLCRRFLNSETGKMILLFLAAKKQKICPMVDIVE